jgi:hypothetical protein
VITAAWRRVSYVCTGPFFVLAFRSPWRWSGSQILAACYGVTALILLVCWLAERIRHGQDGIKARWDRPWPGPRPLGSWLLDLLAGLGLCMGAVVAWHLVTG